MYCLGECYVGGDIVLFTMVEGFSTSNVILIRDMVSYMVLERFSGGR